MKSKYYLYKESHSHWHMNEWHRDLMEQPFKYKVFWHFDIPYVLSMKRKKRKALIDSTVLYTMRKDDGRAFAQLL